MISIITALGVSAFTEDYVDHHAEIKERRILLYSDFLLTANEHVSIYENANRIVNGLSAAGGEVGTPAHTNVLERIHENEEKLIEKLVILDIIGSDDVSRSADKFVASSWVLLAGLLPPFNNFDDGHLKLIGNFLKNFDELKTKMRNDVQSHTTLVVFNQMYKVITHNKPFILILLVFIILYGYKDRIRLIRDLILRKIKSVLPFT